MNNSISGADGVVTHGRWLYAGDGDSTLKVFDLESSASTTAQAPLSTGGTTRVDEMDITSDGELLLVANNAEDPPYATLFAANGDRSFSAVQKIMKITVANAIMPAGEGLS
ncbi:MAG: lactonase family protein, partial [Betaproteobacteria bacterium]